MSVAGTRLYDILGVPPSASVPEIKKAYKKLALKHHPDKGGNVDTFKEMTAALEILTNEEKRRIYDEHGEEGLRQAEQGADPSAAAASEGGLFDLFFGGLGGGGLGGAGGLLGGFFGRAGQPRRQDHDRSDSVVFRLQVSLEDVFAGVVKKVAVHRTVACAGCNGTGASDPHAVRTCPRCRGRGVVIVERRFGPMLQRIETTCSECGGAGRGVPAEAVCTSCSGQGVQQERKVLEVWVPPGAHDQQRLVLAGEGDHLPGRRPGDIVAVLAVAAHPRLQRRGDDLALEARVSLAEALGGCKIEVEHLDGRRLALRSPPGEVIKPDSWWRIQGEGMPVYRQGSLRGDLLVNFKVDFPDRLDAVSADQLSFLLGSALPGNDGSAQDGAASAPAPADEERFLEPAPAGRPPPAAGRARL